MKQRLLILLLFIGFIAILSGSLFRKSLNERYPLNNPSDSKSTNYQGYATASLAQGVTVLNADAVSNGVTTTVYLSNYGWKPEHFMASEDAAFTGIAWSAMPSNRIFTFTVSPTGTTHTIYTRFQLPDKSIYDCSNIILYNAALSVAVTSPVNGAYTNVSSITISGTASGNASLYTITKVQVSVNGAGYADAAGTSSWTFAGAALTEGTNTIQSRVINSLGSTNYSSVTTLVRDTSRPSITVTSPAASQTYWTTALTVSGIATETNTSIKNIFVLTNGFTAVTLAPASNYTTAIVFSNDTTLASVGVYCVDVAGNSSTTNSLSSITVLNTFYASTNGNDLNSGIKTAPVRTVQLAVNRAVASNVPNVFVSEGFYKPTAGLNATADTNGVFITNNNLILRGGWNIGFTAQPSYSTFDGWEVSPGSGPQSRHMLLVRNASNISIQRLRISSAWSASAFEHGAGILFDRASDGIVSNCIFASNTGYFGGGFYITASRNISVLNSILYTNSTRQGRGSAFGIASSTNCTIRNLTCYSNYMDFTTSGGCVYLSSCNGVSISNSVFTNNFGTNDNAVFLIDGTFVNTAIQSNVIGGFYGTTNAVRGFYERAAANGHTIVNNRFIIDTYDNAYYDSVNGSGKATNYINDSTFFDGASATGNSVLAYTLSNWTQATSAFDGTRGIQDHQGLVTNGNMYIVCGNDNANGLFLNDVYFSSDGVSWTLYDWMSGTQPPVRFGHRSVIYGTNCWIVGGYNNTGTRVNDVYRAPNNPVDDWVQVTASAAFSPRVGHQLTVFRNSMWLTGGYATNGAFNWVTNDVWYSTNGTTWTIASSGAASFRPRMNHASAVFKNNLWVVGGNQGGGWTNDVWYSPNGTNWSLATASANFSPRYGHELIVYKDHLWLIGGAVPNAAGVTNDIWCSGDGTNWYRVTTAAGFYGRAHFSALPFSDKIWILMGDDSPGDQGSLKDVWSAQ